MANVPDLDFLNGVLLSSFTAGDTDVLIGSSIENSDGSRTIHYRTGQKCIEGRWINGKPEGCLRSWYESGVLRQEANFRDGQLDGLYKLWHPNGQLNREGQYHLHQKRGVWREWNASGALIREEDHG